MKEKELEKINLIKSNHFPEWIKTRQIVEDEISKGQSIFCVCGKLATGLHEKTCRKFFRKVDKETMKRLKHLKIDFSLKKEI